MCLRAGAVLVHHDSSESALAAACDSPSVPRCDSPGADGFVLGDSFWQEAVAVSQMPELRCREAGEAALKRTAGQRVSREAHLTQGLLPSAALCLETRKGGGICSHFFTPMSPIRVSVHRHRQLSLTSLSVLPGHCRPPAARADGTASCSPARCSSRRVSCQARGCTRAVSGQQVLQALGFFPQWPLNTSACSENESGGGSDDNSTLFRSFLNAFPSQSSFFFKGLLGV